MATTITKLNDSVLIERGGLTALPRSAVVSLGVNPDIIEIQNKVGIWHIHYSDVTTPATANRNDLYTLLVSAFILVAAYALLLK